VGSEPIQKLPEVAAISSNGVSRSLLLLHQIVQKSIYGRLHVIPCTRPLCAVIIAQLCINSQENVRSTEPKPEAISGNQP